MSKDRFLWPSNINRSWNETEKGLRICLSVGGHLGDYDIQKTKCRKCWPGREWSVV